MATTREFQDMLNEYLPNSLLKEEMVDRTWILKTFEMDNSWLGGTYIVPFKGATASSVEFGALPSSTDIAQSDPVRGQVSTQPEMWGSLIFYHRDLMEHGKLSEQNLLRLLPDEVEDFIEYIRMAVSLALLNGARITRAVADGTVGGDITVANPERLTLGQKVTIDDDNSSPVNGYVRAINMNTRVVSIYDARTAGAVVDLSGYTTAQNAGLFWIGAQSAGFTSLKSSLLPASAGGSSTLYGQTKTAYPYLQAQAYDGSAVTSTTFLSDLASFQVQVRQRGRGNPDMLVMSYRNFGWVQAILEATKGAFNVVPGSQKSSPYGWKQIEVFGPKGSMTLVGLNEMDDDYVMALDKRAAVIASNGGFRKRKAPDGREYFEQRATTGYSYIVDTCFFGDLILQRPSYCGILYNIPVS
jgi:hypothetical protein